MKQSGIYKIESKLKPERIYIGSAKNINERWRYHLNDLKENKHHSHKLQRHYLKYGESDLQFSILLGCEKEELLKVEQYFLDSYNPYFNICKIAGSCLGVKQSESTKQKKREIALRNGNKPPNLSGTTHVCSEKTKLKISISKIGFKHTEETCRKIGIASKGRKLSTEVRQRLSDFHKGKNFNPPVSDETKQRMAKAQKNRWALKKLMNN